MANLNELADKYVQNFLDIEIPLLEQYKFGGETVTIVEQDRKRFEDHLNKILIEFHTEVNSLE
jgi:division protein CdvB (Snf7/Vps24/ESCRT-III family)